MVSPSDLGAEGLSSLNRREVFNNYPHEEIEVELIVIEDYLDIPNEKQIFAKTYRSPKNFSFPFLAQTIR